MPSGTLPPAFNQQFIDNSGARPFVAIGYLLDQLAQGTPDDEDTFTDEDMTVPNTHPITLNGAGKVPVAMWLDPAKRYTFVLRTPLGVQVDTWDVTPTQIPVGGDFVPLDGSVEMTGLLTLSGDATSSLNPVTKQQLDSSITAALASVTALTDAATAAAAAATAAAAAIKPTFYSLASETGTSVTRDVDLTAGTWQVVLITSVSKEDSGGATYNFDATQSASVSTTTVNTSIPIVRTGGSGYGRAGGGADIAVGSLVVGADATVSMSMAAVSLSSAASAGSILMIHKVA